MTSYGSNRVDDSRDDHLGTSQAISEYISRVDLYLRRRIVYTYTTVCFRKDRVSIKVYLRNDRSVVYLVDRELRNHASSVMFVCPAYRTCSHSTNVLVPVKDARSNRDECGVATIYVFRFLYRMFTVIDKVGRARFVARPLSHYANGGSEAFRDVYGLSIGSPNGHNSGTIIKGSEFFSNIRRGRTSNSMDVLHVSQFRANLARGYELLVSNDANS